MFPWDIICISGVSGSGRAECLKAIWDTCQNVQFCNLPTKTTRSPRRNEPSWYEFITYEEYQKLKAAREILWADVAHGDVYLVTKEDFSLVHSSQSCLIVVTTAGNLATVAHTAIREYGIAFERMLFLHMRTPIKTVWKERLREAGYDEGAAEHIMTWIHAEKEAAGAHLPFPLKHKIPITYVSNDSTIEALHEEVRALFT